jgi:hypothetical protein
VTALRWLAVAALLTGAAILFAVAHVNIVSAGGYGTPFSYVTMAACVGVIVASVVIGAITGTGRQGLVAAIAFTIITGEAFNLMVTSDRLIKQRDAEQAPLREAQEVRAKAQLRVTNAQYAVDHPSTTSPGLQTAQAAKAAAAAAVVEKSAERGCRENCRQMLQAQVDAAAEEVGRAQAELNAARTAAAAELTAARSALDGIKMPPSPTPLADRTGVPAWIIDLVQSGLGSIAANGLASCLLIFGAHQLLLRVETLTPVLEPEKAAHLSAGNGGDGVSLRQHAARFGLECLRRGGEAEVLAIRASYRMWALPHEKPSAVWNLSQEWLAAASLRVKGWRTHPPTNVRCTPEDCRMRGRYFPRQQCAKGRHSG